MTRGLGTSCRSPWAPLQLWDNPLVPEVRASVGPEDVSRNAPLPCLPVTLPRGPGGHRQGVSPGVTGIQRGRRRGVTLYTTFCSIVFSFPGAEALDSFCRRAMRGVEDGPSRTPTGRELCTHEGRASPAGRLGIVAAGRPDSYPRVQGVCPRSRA